MKKYLLLLLALPLFTHAQYYYYPYETTPYATTPYQTTPYQSSVYADPYTSASSQFLSDLSLGDRGSDVAAMQTWLISHGFDIPSISSGGTGAGYFGQQTKTALQAYQRAVGLPDTGIFGPATRERMRQGYTPAPTIVYPSYQPSYPTYPVPTCGTYYYSQPCQYPTTGYPTSRPVINGVEGPTTLLTGQTGTWTIRATSEYNGTLTYIVNWGDATPTSSSVNTLTTNYVQSASFTHSYDAPGTYAVEITVRNISGYIAKTSITVRVQGQNNGAGNLQIISPNGGENWTRGSTQTIRWTSPYYFRATSADIRLIRYNPCTGPICPAIYYAPYLIASNISINQNAYNWNVGSVIPDVVGGTSYTSVANGPYFIQICERGTNNCDTSDNIFNIY